MGRALARANRGNKALAQGQAKVMGKAQIMVTKVCLITGPKGDRVQGKGHRAQAQRNCAT